MGAFKVVKLVDPIYIATSGVALGHTGGTATSGTFNLYEGNNITFTTAGNSLTIHGGAGAGGGIAAAAGTQTATSGTVNFANSNGITFGMSGSTRITASHNGITLQTNQPVAYSAANGSANFSTLSFADSNGVSFSTGTQGLYATVKTDYQSSNPNYLTSQSNQAVSAANGSFTFQTLTVANSNGVSFSTGTQGLYATVKTDYLTTARASTDAIGLNTAQTNVTWTVNSDGISLNAGGYAGTTSNFAGNLISGSMTHNTAGLNLSLNHPAWLTTAMQSNAATISNINISAGTTSTNASAFTFANANGVSFGLGTGGSVGSITASHNGLTTARASNDAIGLNTAQSNVTWTVNSSGLSFDARGYAGTGTSATNASITLNSAGLAISVAAPGAGGGIGIEAGTRTATTAGTLRFETGNGITFGLNAVGGSVMTASHNGLTTARASTDAIGLNTAGTNITWTANSSGLSIDAAGYAGTGTSKTGGALITLNSNGLAFDGGALAGTATTFNGANISGSMTVNTAGVNLSMSVAAPGAAAENNWVHALGANTAGNTTASGSTIGLSGINLTISGTNNSVMNLSVPATSSLSATGGFQISTNGSTISMGPGRVSSYANILYKPANQTQQVLASTFVVHPFVVSDNVSFDFLRMINSISIASTSFASTANTTFSYNQEVTYRFVLYTRNTGASSMSLASISSTSAGLTQSINAAYGSASNTSQFNTWAITYPISTGTSSFSSGFTTSNLSTMALSTGNYTRMTGYKLLDIPFAGSLTPGDYWFAWNASTTQTTQGTANLSAMRMLHSTIGFSQGNNTYASFGDVNNASIQAQLGVGSFTTVGGATTNSLGFSNISSSASHVVPYFSLSRTTN